MSEPVAAWVGERTLLVSEVDELVARLRGGRLAARLPAEHTAEGRNARRWVVQLRTAEMVVEREIRRLGLTSSGASAIRLNLVSALRVGGVAAAVLAGTPGARGLADRVTGPVAVSEETARDYYDRNTDRFGDGAVSFAEARPRIAAELGAAERDRRFALWLESRQAELVRLAPGYQHPATPGQPDATHRH